MKATNWKGIAELVGITAIIGSLVFVGLQLKQSQDIAIAAQYHDRAALAVENFHGMAELGVTRGVRQQCPIQPTEDQTAEDILTECLFGLAYLTMADNHLYQYESGFMDESAWQAQRRLLQRLLNNSESYKALYQNTRYMRRESFLELADQLITEGSAAQKTN